MCQNIDKWFFNISEYTNFYAMWKFIFFVLLGNLIRIKWFVPRFNQIEQGQTVLRSEALNSNRGRIKLKGENDIERTERANNKGHRLRRKFCYT